VAVKHLRGEIGGQSMVALNELSAWWQRTKA